MSKEKHQRVSVTDAKEILNKLIKDFKTPMQSATCYNEDSCGGSQCHINEDIVEDLIKKLCR